MLALNPKMKSMSAPPSKSLDIVFEVDQTLGAWTVIAAGEVVQVDARVVQGHGIQPQIQQIVTLVPHISLPLPHYLGTKSSF